MTGRLARLQRPLVLVLLLAAGASHAVAQKLTGAGGTFPYPLYSKWFSEYSAAHPGVEINYQPVGSGSGIRMVTAGLVDFGASDGPLTNEALAESRIKLVQIPMVVGAVVPVFNLAGVTELNLSPEVLAEIFLHKIVKWSDARIAKDNPGVHLPDLKIIPVHRSDSSGTSYIFTDYLSKVSPAWAKGPGRGLAVIWPAGIGGKGNGGVAGLVKQLNGSIGYVELTYAVNNGIAVAAVRNPAGKWIKPGMASITAAAASLSNMPADFRVSITNAPGEYAYPIASFTWLLVPLRTEDGNKAAVLKDLLRWILTGGQKDAEALNYAPLPENVVSAVDKAVESLQ